MTSCKACPAGTNTLQNGSQSINDCVGKLEETFGDKKEDSIFFIMAVMGCLPFSKSFQKIRLESKWNKTSWVVPAENFREQLKIWKGSPVFFRTESLKREFRVPFLQSHRLIPVSGLRGRFSGNWPDLCKWYTQFRNVLNFAYIFPNRGPNGLRM